VQCFFVIGKGIRISGGGRILTIPIYRNAMSPLTQNWNWRTAGYKKRNVYTCIHCYTSIYIKTPIFDPKMYDSKIEQSARRT